MLIVISILVSLLAPEFGTDNNHRVAGDEEPALPEYAESAGQFPRAVLDDRR